MADVIKDVLYLTMFMCSMLSPGLLNPDVSCMCSLILIKRRPQMSLIVLNLIRTALRHNILLNDPNKACMYVIKVKEN